MDMSLKIYFFLSIGLGFTFSTALLSQQIDIAPVLTEDARAINIQESSWVGLEIGKTGGPGIKIDTAGWEGIRVRHAFRGILIFSTERNAFEVVTTDESGLRVGHAGLDGLHVNEASRNGVFVEEANVNGIEVEDAGQDGVFVNHADDDGVNILNAGDDGVNVFIVGGDGFQVADAGGHGLFVGNAGGSGIRVNNADGYSLDIQGDKRGLASVQNHIARLQNFNSESGADVLALKVNEVDDPGDNSNFITFFKGGPDNSTSNALGAIEGNGSGGVTFKTSGADFAEALTQIRQDEIIQPGDVVGVYNGRISLQTKGADQVMVITDRPAIIGNHGPEKDSLVTSNVSFIGQVPVRVQGPVQSGDWLVQSGIGDGTARVLNIGDYQSGDHVIGQAWETIYEDGIHKINVVIGVGQEEIVHSNIEQLRNQVHTQKHQLLLQKEINQKQQDEIDELKALITSLIDVSN